MSLVGVVRLLLVPVFLTCSGLSTQVQNVPCYTGALTVADRFLDISTGNLQLEISLGPEEPARNDRLPIKTIYHFNLCYRNSVTVNSHSGITGIIVQTSFCPSGYPVGHSATNSFATNNHATAIEYSDT